MNFKKNIVLYLIILLVCSCGVKGLGQKQKDKRLDNLIHSINEPVKN